MQRLYNDPQETVGTEMQFIYYMTCTLAFIPIDRVEEHFISLSDQIPEELIALFIKHLIKIM